MKINPNTNSLFQFFDGSAAFDHIKRKVNNKTYVCLEITTKEANDIVKAYHYSGKVVKNSTLHLGIFNKQNELVGCLQFGTSMNQQTPNRIVESGDCMFELNRMVMADSEPRNSESQAISLCIKWLRKFRPDIKWLLSFSDGKESNVGYIYQATNWIYIGYIISDSFYDLDGDILHSVSVWHKYKEKHRDRDTKTTHEILFDNFENVSIIESKQHIYVYKLSDMELKFDQQKYPKLENEIPIISKTWLKKVRRNITRKDIGEIF